MTGDDVLFVYAEEDDDDGDDNADAANDDKEDNEDDADEYDDDAVKFLETQITFGLMNSFGYNNVRGGEFKTSRKYNKNPCILKKNLEKWPIEAVKDQINEIIDELKNHPIIDVYLSYQLEKN